MGGNLGDRDKDVKLFHKYEKKCEREMKSLKKQKKLICIIDNQTISLQELKKIKKIFVNEIGVADDVITRDKTEYSSHALALVVGKH